MRSLGVLLSFLLAPALCFAQSPTYRAIEVVQAFSKAVVGADCATYTRLLSPVMVENLPEGQSVGEFLCPLIAEFAAWHLTEELLPQITSLSQDNFRLVIIPSKRFTTVESPPGATMITFSSYWVHSSDSGNTWHVLDLGCMDSKWAKAVYPPYDGYPPAKKATYRLVPKPVAP